MKNKLGSAVKPERQNSEGLKVGVEFWGGAAIASPVSYRIL